MARKKNNSRPARWAAAVTEAQRALSALDEAYSKMESALSAMSDVRAEYEEWKDALPENLQASALGEKLEEVCNLDIPDDARDSTYADLEEIIGQAESIDLPLGFGRD